MRAKMMADRKRKSEEEQERLHWEARAGIARKFARPVERVIAANENAQADLYDVLGIKDNADEGTIKRAYRHLALVIHPGTIRVRVRFKARTWI
jgi:DnaJ-domain-containing protein 1